MTAYKACLSLAAFSPSRIARHAFGAGAISKIARHTLGNGAIFAKRRLILKAINKNFTKWTQIKPFIDQIKEDTASKTKASIAKAKSMYEEEIVPLTFPKGLN